MNPSQPVGSHIRVLDLFSGAGGLTEGFKRASASPKATGRFRTVRAVEADVAAAATFEANHGKNKVFAGPIETWLRTENIPPADVVLGGPPCQGFSPLGKRDVNDQRNYLWRQYADTVRKADANYFVLENVPQFLRSPQFDQLRHICGPRGSLKNYTFQAKVLNAAEYGAAQIRKRVIIIGHHRDLPFPGFPHGAKRFLRPDRWHTVRQALAGLATEVQTSDLPDRTYDFAGRTLRGAFRTDELHVTRHYEDISLERFAWISEGENRFKLPEHLKSDCWRRHTTGSADVMGRLWWDQPSVTIRTEFFKPEKGRYLHPAQPRALTHHEAARIQGFRDSYKWVGSKTSIARQIGNAVPIPLGKAIGLQLLSAIGT